MRVLLIVSLLLIGIVSASALRYSEIERLNDLNRLHTLNRMAQLSHSSQWEDIDEFDPQDMDFDDSENVDYYNVDDDFSTNGQANLGMNLGLGIGLDRQQWVNQNQNIQFQNQDQDQLQQFQYVQQPQKYQYSVDVQRQQQPSWLQQHKQVHYQQPIVTYAQPIVQKVDLSLPNMKQQHLLAQAIVQPTYQTAPVQQSLSLSATAPTIQKGFGTNLPVNRRTARFQNY